MTPISAAGPPLGPEPVRRLSSAPRDLDRVAVHRRARAALVTNMAVAIGLFGLLSIPGAISAGLALRALPAEPARADRLVTLVVGISGKQSGVLRLARRCGTRPW